MSDRAALVIHSGRRPETVPHGTEWMTWRNFQRDGYHRVASARYDRIVALPLGYSLGAVVPGAIPHYGAITDRIARGARAVFCVPPPTRARTFERTRGAIAYALPVCVAERRHPAPGKFTPTKQVGPWGDYLRGHRTASQIVRENETVDWVPLAYASDDLGFDPVAAVCRVGGGFAVVVPAPHPGEDLAALLDALAKTEPPPESAPAAAQLPAPTAGLTAAENPPSRSKRRGRSPAQPIPVPRMSRGDLGLFKGPGGWHFQRCTTPGSYVTSRPLRLGCRMVDSARLVIEALDTRATVSVKPLTQRVKDLASLKRRVLAYLRDVLPSEMGDEDPLALSAKAKTLRWRGLGPEAIRAYRPA